MSNFAFLPRQLPNPLITGSCEARLPSNTHCYEIQDRKTCLTAIDTRKDFKSPCGWCFGEKCTGSQSLCEPMKWLQQNKLKLGQDYEDCLTTYLPSCQARKPNQANCVDIRDRKTCLTSNDTSEEWKSPCGWCFGKNCAESQNLCAPKKWLQQKKLKLLQDYEDCLELGKRKYLCSYSPAESLALSLPQ